jgi:8-oxo-dGTP pyrophosphatase MutT (NUDIX family)
VTAAPEYACAVITDARGWLLLQLRPPTARVAASQVTCFGGRREADEDARACLRRELREELGWPAPDGTACCELWRGERFIARFYALRHPSRLDRPHQHLHLEPGHVAIAAPWPSLPGLPVSPWHRRVLAAIASGGNRVDLDGLPAGRAAD